MLLRELLNHARTQSGLLQKQELQQVHSILRNAHPCPFPNGDDAAVIPRGNEFDLLAGEGFLEQFVKADPWFAGWCGIMVNASDIAAMGGRPVAVVNALWAGQDDTTIALLQGMSDASACYQIPIVGGHSNLRSTSPHLAVSILGRAQALLESFSARSNQLLVAAIDLRGSFRAPFLNWNAATDAPAERLRKDLELLPTIAETGLASAAKDISQAGLLGTTVMLLESAQLGAQVELSQIPKPDTVSWHDWLCAFPSYGYLLTTDEENVSALLNCFTQRDISAAVIGRLNNSKQCKVSYENESSVFWDLNIENLIQPALTNDFGTESFYARNVF